MPPNKPPITAPAGLKRVHAASYMGVSVDKLDALVREGVVMPPRQLGSMKIYSRADLDAALNAAPFFEGDESTGCDNPFDQRLK